MKLTLQDLINYCEKHSTQFDKERNELLQKSSDKETAFDYGVQLGVDNVRNMLKEKGINI